MDKHNCEEEQALPNSEITPSSTSETGDTSTDVPQISGAECDDRAATSLQAATDRDSHGGLEVGAEPRFSDEVLPLSSDTELKSAIEALLFATTEPLSVERLVRILGVANTVTVRTALLQLMQDYDNSPHGIQIVEVAGGFQMATRPFYAPFIFRLKPSRRRNPLSQATLETLAIIAYKQPITRAEIEAIRGVDSTASIHTLLELGLIEVGGKREVPGRPQLYVTTQHFLKTFGLRSLGDLPSIHELKRMFVGQHELERTPVAANKDYVAETPMEARERPHESPAPSCDDKTAAEPLIDHGRAPNDTGQDKTPA
ncbi:MAG: SMC-Scp complex subunit ScpB [Candidatus Sumerlaeaceae bacterium]|nr:SMC-Scp complex subunit ScpB [Candidatus Sumerlaeaceae bacterium]